MSDSNWTPVMVSELERLWAAGWSGSKIGTALGVSKSAVIGKAHRLNLSPRPSPVSRLLTEAAKDEFHRLWSAGKDSNAIAVELGISPGHARQVRFRLKLVRHTAGHIALPAPPARPVVKTAAAPARIEKRPPEGCCWPMWGFRASPTHVYCAAVRPDVAKPYCAEHHQKAFVRINRLAAA